MQGRFLSRIVIFAQSWHGQKRSLSRERLSRRIQWIAGLRHTGTEEGEVGPRVPGIHAAGVDYHIRQPKQHDQGLLPLNSDITFNLDKDKMKFKLNGKKYEYLMVSETSPEAKQRSK